MRGTFDRRGLRYVCAGAHQFSGEMDSSHLQSRHVSAQAQQRVVRDRSVGGHAPMSSLAL